MLGAASLLALLVLALLVFTGRATAAATDLGITKADSPDPVVEGNNLTYTLTVSNTAVGAADAAGVTVTDTLPSQVDFVSASTGCTHKGSLVTCDLGTLAANNTATVTIVVKTKKDGTISNTATVSHNAADSNAQNNSDTESTTVTNKPTAPKPKPKKPKARASCAAPTITGTAGDDVLAGTSHADVIVTFTGNDRVFAGGGNDLICTDGGADFVFADTGRDIVIGGGGADRLIGGGGADALKGKNGRDRLKGGRGNDLLNGGKKRDRCKGGPGRDVLVRCP